MNMDVIVNILGWAGAMAVLAAYSLLSTGRMEGQSSIFQALNLGGSACLIVNTFYYGAYPSAFLNVVWMGIAGYALIGIQRRRALRRS